MWESEHWPRWQEIKDTVQPEPCVQWVDEFLAADAADWAREMTASKAGGIVWYEHSAWGAKVAQLANAPLYGGGDAASSNILYETGERSVIASVKAHGTGKNLQAFARMLYGNQPADGVVMEQSLGRCHRPGQQADEVEATVYRHTDAFADGLRKAIDSAHYIEDTLGTKQKLCYAHFAFDPQSLVRF